MGSLLGGILVGVIESYTAFYSQSSLKSLVSFILLILVLLVRPHGFNGATFMNVKILIGCFIGLFFLALPFHLRTLYFINFIVIFILHT